MDSISKKTSYLSRPTPVKPNTPLIHPAFQNTTYTFERYPTNTNAFDVSMISPMFYGYTPAFPQSKL
ncbi:hypothetical protein A0J61_02860 [Choanephora cucurbitarum]|uniref:Uncharacterized protein n=1 Tax=Choanephora cucurbitarum TaxID=101091 RepID=A0A1C7NIZ7_9FUNG|nr:hypothetical protein A0J61_02860 [Choanephora cucurbitarum]